MSRPVAAGAARDTGPRADVDIDESLVAELVRTQHGDLVGLEVRIVRSGWDNVIARLGDRLAVRLPRRAASAPLVAHELRWLPVLAPRLPLATPRPVRAGAPGAGHPFAWSIVPWFHGETLAEAVAGTDHDAGHRTAARLGRFLRALHVAAPPTAPRNPARGIALSARRELTAAQGATAAELSVFDSLADGPVHTGAPLWLHGDLHPANVLVDPAGGACAVLDFGDLTAGDPATDLAIAWMCFGDETRRTFLDAAGADDAVARRAQAWAVALAVAYRHGAPDDAAMRELARRTLDAACGGPATTRARRGARRCP